MPITAPSQLIVPSWASSNVPDEPWTDRPGLRVGTCSTLQVVPEAASDATGTNPANAATTKNAAIRLIVVPPGRMLPERRIDRQDPPNPRPPPKSLSGNMPLSQRS
jgi:hypothetical protein